MGIRLGATTSQPGRILNNEGARARMRLFADRARRVRDSIPDGEPEILEPENQLVLEAYMRLQRPPAR